MYYLPLLPMLERRHKLSAQKISRIYDIYAQEMINVNLGQAMDIAWHRGLADADTVDEKDYMQMCAYKTGALARMAAKMAAVLADASDELVEKLGIFAESVGVAFQIQDDVLDLTSEEFGKKKGGRGQDITEGKRSLPVIHALKVAKPNDRKRLTEILGMHTSRQNLRDAAIAIMQKYESIEHANLVARKIVEESWGEVEMLLPSSAGKEKLKTFAIFLIEREI
jgi:geranylgeranyl pyrophosphate synthase